jgi:hypothetical protein
MRRLRLLILGTMLVWIALILVLPDVDFFDAAGLEVTSASLISSYFVPTPAVRVASRPTQGISARSGVEIPSLAAEFVHPDFQSSLTHLCLLRC